MAIVKCEKNLFLFIVNIIKIFGDGDGFLHSHIFSQNIKIWSNTLICNNAKLDSLSWPMVLLNMF